MTNLAATRATQGLALTSREGREIVMVHETLALAETKTIEDLLLTRGAKRDDAQNLCLPTSKEGGTMSAGQKANLTTNGTNGLEITTIGAGSAIQDCIANVGF